LRSRFDIVIIGGGPSGATAARVAAEKGAKVFLAEESIPHKKKVQCTGLISLRALEESGVKGDFILREIRGAFIYTPGGIRLNLDGKDIKAVVIDRIRFDQELLKKAQCAGVEVRTGCSAIGLEEKRIKIKENDKEKIVEAGVIIGADGPKSKIAKWVHLPGPKKLLPAVQAIVPYKPEREDFVEVYLGRHVAPDFFAWCVPASDGFARVGLATDNGNNLRFLLGSLLENRFRHRSNNDLKMGMGIIPIGASEKTFTEHVLLVGDAAGQVKPTSGGGIYTGITCARIAGEVAADCVLRGDASAKGLSEYEKRWRSVLQRELFFGLQVHNLLRRLSDENIDRIFSLFNSSAILDIFIKYGDIDYPSLLAKELFRKPTLWGKLLTIIPAKEILTGLLNLSNR